MCAPCCPFVATSVSTCWPCACGSHRLLRMASRRCTPLSTTSSSVSEGDARSRSSSTTCAAPGPRPVRRQTSIPRSAHTATRLRHRPAPSRRRPPTRCSGRWPAASQRRPTRTCFPCFFAAAAPPHRCSPLCWAASVRCPRAPMRSPASGLSCLRSFGRHPAHLRQLWRRPHLCGWPRSPSPSGSRARPGRRRSPTRSCARFWPASWWPGRAASSPPACRRFSAR
mmetsp:Transcript_17853/g.53640  ORF Transcript_17853/g.53640 Transcript_17853/m.53640 type:complete len:225 (+) Transcript_17853:2003-2677(+)